MNETDELAVDTTEGYTVGEKKTIDEYTKLDANDESLNKWKQSLGIQGDTIGDPNDARTVVVLELALEITGRPDVVIPLDRPRALDELRSTPFAIKEGSEYRMRVKHEVISGLRYLQLVKRKGIRVDKSDEMLGSYGPNTSRSPFYEKKFPTEEAPSGMLARGRYEAVAKFVDDDQKTHLQFTWSFEIKKDW